MSERNNQDDAFHNLRKEFDGLDVEAQARFLVEAAMSLVASGAREAGNVVSTVVEDIVESINRERGEEADADEEPAPKASTQKAPRKASKPKAKSTPRKKPAADANSDA